MELEKILQGIADKLIIDFDAISSKVSHRFSKGNIRETEIAEQFLSKYLPRNIGISRGEIVASNGVVSCECDLVFYDKIKTPILIDKSGYKVFPVECVYGVLEVKSNLNKEELQKSLALIQEIKKLPKAAFEPQIGEVTMLSNLFDQQWDYFPTVGFIFAYDSTDLLQLRKDLDELQKNLPLNERVDGVWVLKKGMLINWEDETRKVNHTPTKLSRLRAYESNNPLLLMTILFQQIFQSAWMPKFRVKDYLHGTTYGEPLEK